MTTEKHDTASCAPVERRVMRPGNGWKHIFGPVYEHKSGARIHMLGYVRLPNGEYLSDTKFPESQYAARFIRINGGNKKRGLMAWAMTYNAKLSRASSALNETADGNASA